MTNGRVWYGDAMSETIEFEFDRPREELLSEAATAVRGLGATLSGNDAAAPPGISEALGLLEQLKQNVAELTRGGPRLLPLKRTHFEAQGLPVPPRFVDLAKQHDFYWTRLPLVLRTIPGHGFQRIECAIQLAAAGADDAHIETPRVVTVLPNRKFVEIASGEMGARISLNEAFEFTADGATAIAAASAATGGAVNGNALVGAKAAADLGLLAGPFKYQIRKAKIEHAEPGTEKMFWRVDGEEFFEDTHPDFIAVIQVPKAAERLTMSSAVRAATSFAWWSADISLVFDELNKSLRRFFAAGAPVESLQSWDLSAQLQ